MSRPLAAGEPIVITGTFSIAPDTGVLKSKTPDGMITSYTPTATSSTVYYYDYTPTQTGPHTYRFQGTGTLILGTETHPDKIFNVLPTVFT